MAYNTNWNSSQYNTTYYHGTKPVDEKLEKLLKKEIALGEEHLWYLNRCHLKGCEKDRYARADHCCPKNPNCLLGLGDEDREKLSNDDIALRRLGPNPSSLMRTETDRFIGLKVTIHVKSKQHQ